MAMNAAANALQAVMGEAPAKTQHFANPANDPTKFADPSGAKMQVSNAWAGAKVDERS